MGYVISEWLLKSDIICERPLITSNLKRKEEKIKFIVGGSSFWFSEILFQIGVH